MPHSPKAAVALLLSLLAPLALVLGTAAPAQAADVFRYWAYFTVDDGEFVAQQTGPADAVPADGAIEAYRYAAPADFEQPNLPRADLSELTFEAICADETAAEGEKRVAVLIDYGVEADSEGAEVPQPEAGCAVVAEDANGFQVLEAVAPQVRTDDGLLCAINGYPAAGCAGTADSGTPADQGTVDFALAGEESGEDTEAGSEAEESNQALLLGGVGALVALIIAGGLLLRRRAAA